MTEKELLELESKYCSFGDTVHYLNPPKIFARSEGSYLYDLEGKEYLDLQMWYSACNFGYNNRKINDAIKNQMDTLGQLASQFLTKEKILLSYKIAKSVEDRFGLKGRVHFNVGGSQAIEDSLKIVRNYTKKNLNFAFMGGYHGRTIGATNITSSYRYRERYGHFSDRAFFIPYPYCFRCPYGKEKETCDLYCAKEFEKLFESEYYTVCNPKTKNCEFGAFYIEPIQGTGGYIIPPKDYFKRIKPVLDEYKVLLVSDEIQMGFYRTGKLWSIEHFGVKPDIIVFGKSLTNGMNPLSGLWAREELINPDIFPPGSTHSTFSSNPIGVRAGLEVFNLIEEKDYEKIVEEKGKKFLELLKDLKKKYPFIGDVDGLGLALRVEICEKDGYTPSKRLTDKIVEEGLKANINVNGKNYGLVLDVGGYYKNVLTLAPSLEITDQEIELAVLLLDALFSRVSKDEL
ncbi:MAG: aspartate aminotransferase family protein [Sulfurihydrogenibium sp.]|uniref:aspartate aminotransferase family protein n=1 Tax=Sulfurihydrogenibium sp. TaxID=2053621 RepID=UPI000CACFB7B|nr:MAG: aspartate aminotransferase family protein [Sulfurihydrogenibium sp.]PMP78103.1 MAG: aspartate aminotransferase family protein [Sulfurihydrogenibium sp.]